MSTLHSLYLAHGLFSIVLIFWTVVAVAGVVGGIGAAIEHKMNGGGDK